MVGFINGDILGATLELVELIILFTTLAFHIDRRFNLSYSSWG